MEEQLLELRLLPRRAYKEVRAWCSDSGTTEVSMPTMREGRGCQVDSA